MNFVEVSLPINKTPHSDIVIIIIIDVTLFLNIFLKAISFIIPTTFYVILTTKA